MYQQTHIVDKIGSFIRNPSARNRLILINILIWLLISVSSVVASLFQTSDNPVFDIWHLKLLDWLAIPSSVESWLAKPWTLITYMFFHIEFLHLLFNMIWLYWFGKIYLEFRNDRKLYALYFIGGICGALTFIFAYNAFPVFENVVKSANALGASGAVLSIVIATAVLVPDYTVNLLFLGQIKIKYIALLTIGLDILMIPSGNAGGHFTHLGGAIAGFLYVKFPVFISSISKQNTFRVGRFFRPKIKKVHISNRPLTDEEYNKRRAMNQEKVDIILDKIANSGYKSLTDAEKEFLFKYSNK